MSQLPAAAPPMSPTPSTTHAATAAARVPDGHDLRRPSYDPPPAHAEVSGCASVTNGRPGGAPSAASIASAERREAPDAGCQPPPRSDSTDRGRGVTVSGRTSSGR
ncbi:hypothetical protein STRIP9103_01632, partial [Streptomyces ipomoeae 91-03]